MNSKPPERPVLLIDDSHEDLFLTKRLLARAEIQRPIVTVDDGEEALIFLRAATLAGASDLLPCCIFCDVKMPKMNGFLVLKWAKEQPLLINTTFAILTGGDVPEDREKAAKFGADFFLVKYPSPAVFKQVLEKAGGR